MVMIRQYLIAALVRISQNSTRFSDPMGDRLLVIDTATAACSVALFEDNASSLHMTIIEIGRGHAEKLVPMISALPRRGQAESILVNCGPGSFTGARIGISVAKALALAWKASLKGYQCLQLVAAQELSKTKYPNPVFVCMLAGHGEYFAQKLFHLSDSN